MHDVEELPIELCVFELRFHAAYMLWDRAGAIWTEMINTHPQLTLSVVQPNQQAFETKDIQAVIELSLARVSARGPKPIEEATDCMSCLLPIIADKLQLRSLERVGFRIIRTREFGTAKEAIRFAGADNYRDKNALGAEAERVGFIQSHRLEAEKFGLQSFLKVEEREVSFNAPWDARGRLLLEAPAKKWIFQADADYYTIGRVERESFDPKTWARQAVKTINRGWELLV